MIAALADGRPIRTTLVVGLPLLLIGLAWATWPLVCRAEDQPAAPSPVIGASTPPSRSRDAAASGPLATYPLTAPFAQTERTADPAPSKADLAPGAVRRRLIETTSWGRSAADRRAVVRLASGGALLLLGLQILLMVLEFAGAWESPVLSASALAPFALAGAALYLKFKYRHSRIEIGAGRGFPTWALTPVTASLLAGAIGLFLARRFHHHQDVEPVVVAGFLLAAPLVGLAGWLDGPILWKRSAWGAMVTLGVCLGIGPLALLDADRNFDRTSARLYTVAVRDHRISHGRRSDSYYLTLEPWAHDTAGGEVSVSQALYEAAAVGSRVCIRWRPGALGSPWYDVDLCRRG